MIRSKAAEPPRVESPISSPSINKPISPQPIPEVATTMQTVTAVIGPKIRFKGELIGEEDLLVQGQVDGTIDLKDHNLTVGEQGLVKANVLAKTIIIEGAVEGDIYGKDRISIKSSSNVKGNLVADRVTLEDGAKFKGSIDMDISAHKSKFEPSKATSAQGAGTSATTAKTEPA